MMRRFRLVWAVGLGCVLPALLSAHVGHGHALPVRARRLINPLATPASAEDLAAGQTLFQRECASCHGDDGKANTKLAARLARRPANLTDHVMDSMRDGEIWWVETHGVKPAMPALGKTLNARERWQVVAWVRELRKKQVAVERAKVAGDYDWQLPPGFPYPAIPADNPVTKAKVALGRYLFYDKRLSANETQSCATCHQQRLAFSDGRARGLGSTGELHPRGPMGLANVAYSPALTWANPNMRTLEAQLLVPIFGEHPVELGMMGKEDILVGRLMSEPKYPALFREAFPGEKRPINLKNMAKALATFERTIISGRSPFDQYRTGENANAISKAAKRGEALFYSERTECFHCHGGFNFTGTLNYLDKGFAEVEFHNNGLYNVAGEISYPADNTGLYEFTQDPSDVGKFKAPSLRNVALTAPYMHDGSIATLEGVLDHYSAGGRTISSGANSGVGANNPNKSEFIKPIGLTKPEKRDLLAFLESLTDPHLLADERYSDPWVSEDQRTKHALRGVVKDLDQTEGTILIKHGPIAELMPTAMTMEYHVAKPEELKGLKAGDTVTGDIWLEGSDYYIEHLRAVKP